MALIVQKYGGTSVGTTEKIENVAEKVIKWRDQGHSVVVVVSAMSGETNRLVDLAHAIAEKPDARELDVLLSTGEQVTIATNNDGFQFGIRDFDARSEGNCASMCCMVAIGCKVPTCSSGAANSANDYHVVHIIV